MKDEGKGEERKVEGKEDRTRSNLIVAVSVIVGAIIISASIIYTAHSLRSSLETSMVPPRRAIEAERPQQRQKRPQQRRPVPKGIVDFSRIKLTRDYRMKGNPKAPATMVIYSDFQCPFCGKLARTTLAKIDKEYVETGKVKVVFKHLPLPFHRNAQKAAEAAECAGEQGKFWQMHDKLFENQYALDIESLKKHAKGIGLNMKKFEKCLDNGEKALEVSEDASEARSFGIGGTPTTIINGRVVRGAVPYDVFKTVIEEELAKAK